MKKENLYRSYSDTQFARIYLSGPIDIIKQKCREYCKKNPLCVNVQETLFIYDGGEEYGACVELINYPKFPKHIKAIRAIAKDLALELREVTYQDSILVMDSEQTVWWTSRERK